MSNRRDTRRHRGRNRMPAPNPNRPPRPYSHQREMREVWDSKATPDRETKAALERWPQVVKDPLYVYFIQGESGGAVKIGQARDPHARRRELQCGNPDELVLVALVLANDETERSIHLTWRRDALVRGEWFGGGFEDVIVSLAAEACRRQLAAHDDGVPLFDITEMAALLLRHPSRQVSPFFLRVG